MVFMVSKNKQPLAPTSNARARMLLKKGKAVIYKHFPFVICLKENKKCEKEFVIKIDPGANITGIAIVDNIQAFFFFELIHRGKMVKKSLIQKKGVRRSRRQRNTRYRKVRFLNRRRKDGWLPPSVKSRVNNIINFVKKYQKYIPLKKCVIEHVSFDVANMSADTDLSGKEYQEGSLYQTTLRKFIFKKYDNRCVYCQGASGDRKLEVEHVRCVYCQGASGDRKLEVEHVLSKAKDGTNSIHNLVLSCNTCNDKKDALSLKEFGKIMGKDYSHLEPKKTPKDAAIIQSARNYVIIELSKLLEVSIGYGWQTSYQRKEVGLPKEHYYDALCVGDTYNYTIKTDKVLIVKANGRGNRQMCLMDGYGFPRTKAKSTKSYQGFQTGDTIKAIVPSGLKQGKYLGRVAIRSSGSFNITTKNNIIQGIGYQHCKIIQKSDGYAYNMKGVNGFLFAMNDKVSTVDIG